MNYEIIENTFLNEKTYIFDHPTGLKIYITPKPGYSKQCAIFGVDFGSIVNSFKLPQDQSFTNIPDGVAHFLEHKLFESEDGDAFSKYAQTGASANAFTSFTTTAYYFTCTDRFEENLVILSDLMQNPYFTPENVQKEQGIIGQEINMYLDNPGWRVYFNMLGGMYHNFPVKNDIAGSIESISKITSDLLYKCFGMFYNAPNMVLSITGDLDPIKTAEYAGKLVENMKPGQEVDKHFDDEPDSIVKGLVEQNLSVSMPLFHIGFKDNFNNVRGADLVKKDIIGKITLDILFGRSSTFYDDLYKTGLINDSFDLDYTCEPSYSHSIISGESNNPDEVLQKAHETIDSAINNGIDENAFHRQLILSKSSHIRQFNNVESLARNMMDAHFKGFNIYEFNNICSSITVEDIMNNLKNNFKKELCVLSVINPK